MADVNISKYRASVVRSGSAPATPGFVVSEGQNPVEPAGSEQNHLPVTINATATGLAITTDQVLSGAGTVGQYIRGDGSLADFPASTGGGSSVSYYLNGSISQGTIGGVAYKELSKTPILGAGTQFTINADGYIASFLTDAGDPNLLEIPGGNWNFETYFSASSGGGSPTFYVELYKYDGSTFTLIASNSGSPELIAFGTNINSYFSTLAVPTTALTLTDRLAIRYYVTHSGRTITLHTENNTLCQIITTFTTGLTALNGLTAQVQYFAVGTSGTDFNISSATQTHTFNLPTASASNRGALSSADWSTFNAKQNALTLTTSGSSGASTLVGATLNVPTYTLSGLGGVPTSRQLTINGTAFDLSADRSWSVGTVTSVGLSSATSGVTIGSTPVTGSGTITLAIATATSTQQGLLSSTDWSTFNNKQNAITLTTTGTSGAATLVGATLNIPQYQAAGTYVTSVTASSPLASSGGTTPNITIQQASGSQSGFLSSTDWTTFNNKQNALTNPVTGTGTTNYLPKFTGSTTIGNSNLINDASGNLGLGVTPTNVSNYIRLQISGTTGGIFDLLSGSTRHFTIYNDSSSSIIGTVTNTPLIFQTNDGTKMTLAANGNVGIGTSSPTNGLLVINSTAATGVRFALESSGTMNGIVALGSNAISGLATTDLALWTRGVMAFETGASGEKMRITSGGNVGIGTASPSAVLEVSGGNGNQLDLDNTGQQFTQMNFRNNGTQRSALWIDNTNSLFEHYVVSGYGQTFYTNASERMRITSGGNVLIGTTTDFTFLGTTSLNVDRNFNSGHNIRISNQANNSSASANLILGTFGNSWVNGLGSNSSTLGNNLYWAVDASTSPLQYKMVLTTSGNLLIGTTSDNGARLQVSGTSTFGGRLLVSHSTSGNYGAVIYNTSATGEGLVVRGGSTSSHSAFVVQPYDGSVSLFNVLSTGAATFSSSVNVGGVSANTDFRIYRTVAPSVYFSISAPGGTPSTSILGVSGADVMSLTAGGNVGIGTSSPSDIINLAGGASGSYGLVIDNSKVGGGVKAHFQYDADNQIASVAGITTNGLVFKTLTSGNVTEKMRITSGGLVGIGTSSPSTLLHVNGYSAANWISTQSNTGTSGHTMYFGYNDGSSTTYGLYITGGRGLANQLDFAVENKFYVNGNGNVLIGTTTDNGAKLNINGTIRTANPTGSTSDGWLLGRALVSGSSTPDRWIRVQIGNLYYDILSRYIGSV